MEKVWIVVVVVVLIGDGEMILFDFGSMIEEIVK